MERRTAKEVLHAILHSILFHRLFGTIKPQTFEVLDVTMVYRPRYLNPTTLQFLYFFLSWSDDAYADYYTNSQVLQTQRWSR